jgi:nucleoid-associated protein YgaU
MSRYNGAEVIADEKLLRNRITIFISGSLSFPYEDVPENLRYIVRQGDRIDHLATAFYGNPRLWWVLVEFQKNPLQNPWVLKPGLELFIPSYTYIAAKILRGAS